MAVDSASYLLAFESIIEKQNAQSLIAASFKDHFAFRSVFALIIKCAADRRAGQPEIPFSISQIARRRLMWSGMLFFYCFALAALKMLWKNFAARWTPIFLAIGIFIRRNLRVKLKPIKNRSANSIWRAQRGHAGGRLTMINEKQFRSSCERLCECNFWCAQLFSFMKWLLIDAFRLATVHPHDNIDSWFCERYRQFGEGSY